MHAQLQVCTYVQNLNMLQPKLWPVVQFTDQWANKFTKKADSNYNYNDYNNYNDIIWKCDHLSSAEIFAKLIIIDVCKALWKVLLPLQLPKPDTNTWQSWAHSDWDRWNFSKCIGTIDCKHLIIMIAASSASLLQNYKGTFSIVLLAVVDSH